LQSLGRALQRGFGSLISILGSPIVAAAVRPEHRARAMGLITTLIPLSGLVGPAWAAGRNVRVARGLRDQRTRRRGDALARQEPSLQAGRGHVAFPHPTPAYCVRPSCWRRVTAVFLARR
jgi:hypothetical protein